MKTSHIFAAVAATALVAGAAFAQQPSTTTTTTTTETVAPPQAVAPTGQATETSATAVDASGAKVTTSLVSNGPVPDTPENRAKYGGPMSHAGKHTAAKGN